VATSTSVSTPRSRAVVSGGLLVLLAAVGFSIKAILVKLAYAYSPKLDAITLMSLRMLLSLPFFLAVALWTYRNGEHARLTTRELSTVAGLGVLGFYLAGLLDFAGLSYISAGLERLILFLYPTLVVIFSALFFSRPIAPSERIALLLSYSGIALVFGGDTVRYSPHLFLGSALVFGAALTFAVYILNSNRYVQRLGSARYTAYVMTSACIATGMHSPPPTVSPTSICRCRFTGLPCSWPSSARCYPPFCSTPACIVSAPTPPPSSAPSAR